MHRGQEVEKIVRNSGYSLTKLAANLHISRNTLYSRFADAALGYSFIMKIGSIICYDFSTTFPEIQQDPDLEKENAISMLAHQDESTIILHLKGKYTKLLEKYNKLLSVLIKIAHRNEMHQLKNELIDLVDSVMLKEKDNT